MAFVQNNVILLGIYLCAIILQLPLFFLMPSPDFAIQMVLTIGHAGIFTILTNNLHSRFFRKAILGASMVILVNLAFLFALDRSVTVLVLTIVSITLYLRVLYLLLSDDDYVSDSSDEIGVNDNAESSVEIVNQQKTIRAASSKSKASRVNSSKTV